MLHSVAIENQFATEQSDYIDKAYEMPHVILSAV